MTSTITPFIQFLIENSPSDFAVGFICGFVGTSLLIFFTMRLIDFIDRARLP